MSNVIIQVTAQEQSLQVEKCKRQVDIDSDSLTFQVTESPITWTDYQMSVKVEYNPEQCNKC